MDTENEVYIPNAILLRHEEGWNNAISSYREETRGDHPKWNNWERERQIIESIISVESKSGYKWASLQNANRFTDSETYAYENGKVAGGGGSN